MLPLHFASKGGNYDVVKFLHSVYPEAVREKAVSHRARMFFLALPWLISFAFLLFVMIRDRHAVGSKSSCTCVLSRLALAHFFRFLVVCHDS